MFDIIRAESDVRRAAIKDKLSRESWTSTETLFLKSRFCNVKET